MTYLALSMGLEGIPSLYFANMCDNHQWALIVTNIWQ
jgi:hypothetical protein